MNNLQSPCMVAGVAVSWWLDRGRIRDEREELIQLKSFNVSHWATLATLLLFLVLSIRDAPGAQTVIWAILVASIYGEIAAKIYFRRTL